MDAVQQYKKKKLDQVIEAYEEHQSDFDTIPVMGVAFKRLVAIDVAMNDSTQKQITVITGITKTKADLKSNAGTIAFTVANGISSWATDNNNLIVLAQVKYTEIGLSKLTDSLVEPTCRNIYDLANKNAAELVPYGITADMLQQFLAAIEAYVAANTKPRKQILERKAETGRLKTLFTEAEKIYKSKTTKLVVQLKNKFPDAFNAYMAAIKPPAKGGAKDEPPITPIV